MILGFVVAVAVEVLLLGCLLAGLGLAVVEIVGLILGFVRRFVGVVVAVIRRFGFLFCLIDFLADLCQFARFVVSLVEAARSVALGFGLLLPFVLLGFGFRCFVLDSVDRFVLELAEFALGFLVPCLAVLLGSLDFALGFVEFALDLDFVVGRLGFGFLDSLRFVVLLIVFRCFSILLH